MSGFDDAFLERGRFTVQPEGWVAGVRRSAHGYRYVIYREERPGSYEFITLSKEYETPSEAYRGLYRELGREGVDWYRDRFIQKGL